MLLCFTLSMPKIGSWNGKWTGSDNLYARVENIGRSKSADIKANNILEKQPFTYNFGDGWVARVSVRAVDSKEAAKIRKLTKGFCNYDWMIESILNYNEIRG